MKQRNTLQKEVTYNALRSFSGHPTAEDIYARVHEEYPHISKATIYRNLTALEDNGSIGRVQKIGNGADRYDWNTKPHFHAKCLKCGKMFDVDLPVDPSILERVHVMEDETFTMDSYQVVFEGICSECRDKE